MNQSTHITLPIYTHTIAKGTSFNMHIVQLLVLTLSENYDDPLPALAHDQVPHNVCINRIPTHSITSDTQKGTLARSALYMLPTYSPALRKLMMIMHMVVYIRHYVIHD